ncbi:MAG: PEP-CTERM sorting domain-containing protein [Pirellulaceae bacterium]|nr:PEP-CTERM sorting domain-containing protein [Pirellulaceae bacterium]
MHTLPLLKLPERSRPSVTVTWIFTFCLSVGLTFVGPPSTLFATTVAYSVPSGLFGTSTDTLGFAFTVKSSELTSNQVFKITDLGAYDVNGDNFQGAVEVGVYRAYDGALMASVSLPASTSESLESGFRYASITEVALALDTEYRIVRAVTDSQDGNHFYDNLISSPTSHATFHNVIDPGIGYITSGSSGSLGFPTVGESNFRYYTANFKFEIETVPEPSSLVLGSLGLVGLAGVGFFRARKRQTCV